MSKIPPLLAQAPGFPDRLENRYLDELEWRFNNRENPFLFRDTIMRLADGDPLRPAFGGLRERDLEDAVTQFGLGLRVVHVGRQCEHAAELTA